MPLYRATVEMLVEAKDDIEAYSVVNEMLREQLRYYVPASCLLDWQFHGNDPREAIAPSKGYEFTEYAEKHL